jgi:hypothetical protein
MNKKQYKKEHFNPHRVPYLTPTDISYGITKDELDEYLLGILEEKVREKQTNRDDYEDYWFKFWFNHSWVLQTQFNDSEYYGLRDVEKVLGEEIDTRVWNDWVNIEEDGIKWDWDLEGTTQKVFGKWFYEKYGKKYGGWCIGELEYSLNDDYEKLPQKVQDEIEKYIYGELIRDTFRIMYDITFEEIVRDEVYELWNSPTKNLSRYM